ncbi:MAG: tRNA methyl transferase PRC-barrel domain-containing protein, partial [Actinomycetota bacterium]
PRARPSRPSRATTRAWWPVATASKPSSWARGADPAKDQSYVLSMLGQRELARTLFPVGELTKDAVRAEAEALGLRTAAKPDSQDVCFITSTDGRAGFLADRLDPTPADVRDPDGTVVGHVDSVELVTIGQRRGLGLPGGTPPQYVTGVSVADPATGRPAEVQIGRAEDLLVDRTSLTAATWVDGPAEGPVLAQASAHGAAAPAGWDGAVLTWDEPRRRVAPGQTVALYDPTEPDLVLGGAIAA